MKYISEFLKWGILLGVLIGGLYNYRYGDKTLGITGIYISCFIVSYFVSRTLRLCIHGLLAIIAIGQLFFL